MRQLQSPQQNGQQGSLGPPATLPRANLRPVPGTGPRPPAQHLPLRPASAALQQGTTELHPLFNETPGQR